MLERLGRYEMWVPVLLRIGVGLTFFFAGLGKVTGGMDRVAGFFGSLGIPLPWLVAPFIAYLELLGGLAVLSGTLTRLFGLLFVANMTAAILLARLPAATEAVLDFSQIRLEMLLLLSSLALACSGAGPLAIDKVIGRKGRSAGNRAA